MSIKELPSSFSAPIQRKENLHTSEIFNCLYTTLASLLKFPGTKKSPQTPRKKSEGLSFNIAGFIRPSCAEDIMQSVKRCVLAPGILIYSLAFPCRPIGTVTHEVSQALSPSRLCISADHVIPVTAARPRPIFTDFHLITRSLFNYKELYAVYLNPLSPSN